MTVHATRIVFSGSNSQGIETAINALTNQYSEVLPEQATAPGPTTFGETTDGPTVEASQAVIRVSEQNASKADVVSRLMTNLPATVAWGGVWYHYCPHDEPNPGDCPAWSLEDGVNPADIPEIAKP